MVGANLLQLFAGTLVSMIAAYLATSVEQLLLIIGLGMTFISGVAFYQRNRGIRRSRLSWQDTATLLRFGLVRVPGLLFQFFLLAGAPLLALTYLSLIDQAFLNAGISLVRSLLIVVGPLGIVLLPQVSSRIGGEGEARLRSNLTLLVKATFYYAAVIGLALSNLSGEILDLWLGSVTEAGTSASELLLLSVPFFVLCVILRSPIDAGSFRGYNSLIYGVGVVTMIGIFFSAIRSDSNPLIAAAWTFLGGHIVAGVASLIVVKKIFNLKIFSLSYVFSMIIALLTLFILFALNPYTGISKLFISFGSVFLLCLIHFSLSKEQWTVQLRDLLRKKPLE